MGQNQKGFGAFEVLLILVGLALLGLLGWYVWTAKQATDKKNSTEPSQTTQSDISAITPKQKTHLEIKEWGVRLKPASRVPDMTYTISQVGDAAVAKFSFEASTAECNGYYWLARAKSGQNIDGLGNTPEQLAAIDATSVKRLGAYYYTILHDQKGCSSNDVAVAKYTSFVLELRGNSNSYTIQTLSDSD